MSKVLVGKVVSLKMQDTILVEIVRRTPHKLYKKLLKRSKKYKVAPNGFTPELGNTVKIEETIPVSKEKHFKVIEIEGQTEQSEGARLQAKQSLAKTREGEKI